MLAAISRDDWARMEPWERDHALLVLVGKLADIVDLLQDRIDVLEYHDKISYEPF